MYTALEEGILCIHHADQYVHACVQICKAWQLYPSLYISLQLKSRWPLTVLNDLC